MPDGIGKIHHISQEKQIDEGGDPDFFPVQEEVEDQQDQIDDHINDPIGKHRVRRVKFRKEPDPLPGFEKLQLVPDPVGKYLKGIHPQRRVLKHSDRKPGEQYPGDGHKESFFQHKTNPETH